jgi:hypothetical protein
MKNTEIWSFLLISIIHNLHLSCLRRCLLRKIVVLIITASMLAPQKQLTGGKEKAEDVNQVDLL